MQRDIKFRIWAETDDAEAEMIYLDKGEFDNGLWFEAHKHLDKHHELMQLSGLKDKNGKDIYEGDILRVITKALPKGKDASGYTYVGEVRFEYGEFVIKFKEKFGFKNTLNIWALNHSEIIGNIFENPQYINTDTLELDEHDEIDEEFGMNHFCQKCQREYDAIDFEYQMCHHCKN